MKESLSISEISKQITNAAAALGDFCKTMPDEQFFFQPEGKWSAAQQVKHLITATNTSRLALILPRWLVRFVGGKPNRPSRSYDELVAKYKLKLAQGGKASVRYIPKPVHPSTGKEKLLERFSRSMDRFAKSLEQNLKEPLPDLYIVPHPLLGKITLRELCYFTIHHTRHHLDSIRHIPAA